MVNHYLVQSFYTWALQHPSPVPVKKTDMNKTDHFSKVLLKNAETIGNEPFTPGSVHIQYIKDTTDQPFR